MSFFLITDLSALSLEDVDSVSEADRDTLAPLPPPAWNNQYPYSNNSYVPQNISYIPPYSYTSTDSQSYMGSFIDGADKSSMIGAGGVIGVTSIGNGGGNNSGGSVHSASGEWHGGMIYIFPLTICYRYLFFKLTLFTFFLSRCVVSYRCFSKFIYKVVHEQDNTTRKHFLLGNLNFDALTKGYTCVNIDAYYMKTTNTHNTQSLITQDFNVAHNNTKYNH